MNAKEQGFLLLTSALGDPGRNPLTVSQFRTLAKRVTLMEKPEEERELTEEDLIRLGYDRRTAFRIVNLLKDEQALALYLGRGRMRGCFPISRASENYPIAVRRRLGLDAPGCLWAKGDIALLQTPMISLVGSRDLAEPNREFAEAVGREAARQGITLVSGNARGADRTAQDACLTAGGRVISVVADALEKYPLSPNVLYLCEDSFDLPFSGIRALSRNRVIHTLGSAVFIAQCTLGNGGTWDGTVKNLRYGWTPVFCFDDKSRAAIELEQRGAVKIKPDALGDFSALPLGLEPLI